MTDVMNNPTDRKLPVELTDMIIDHLHGDRGDLASSSLVCKAWLPATRYHLFNPITLTPTTIQGFMTLAESPFATPSRYIRHLALESDKDVSFDGVLPHPESLAAALPALDTLCISFLDWQNLDLFSRNSILSSFQSIKRLELKYLRVSSPSELMELIYSFPLLEDLVFVTLSFDNASDFRQRSLRPSPVLRSLSISGKSPTNLLTCLCEHKQIPPLPLLRIVLSKKDLPSIARSLQVFSSSLLEVDIPCSSNNIADELCGFILSHRAQLRALRFYSIDLTHESSIPEYLRIRPSYPSLIAQMIHPGVRSLAFSFHITSIDDLNNPLFDWDRLVSALEGSSSAGLTSLVFSCYLEEYEDDVRAFFRRKLPACEARGILVIQ